MQRYLHALCTVVIALCGVLLVAVPRFFLLPPVPVGIVAHNMHRLPPNHRGEAEAATGKRYHNKEFFESGGHGIKLVSFERINNHHESKE
jgi:hypothetical protein